MSDEFDDLDWDEDDNYNRWEYGATIYDSTGNNRNIVARFDSFDEAMLCLPALSRILKKRLFLVNGKPYVKANIPLPDGCSVQDGGILYCL